MIRLSGPDLRSSPNVLHQLQGQTCFEVSAVAWQWQQSIRLFIGALLMLTSNLVIYDGKRLQVLRDLYEAPHNVLVYSLYALLIVWTRDR